MEHIVVLLASLAALMPVEGPAELPQDVPGVAAAEAEAALYPSPETPTAPTEQGPVVLPIADGFRAPIENQVRIEQRITIRIAPRGAVPRPLMFDPPDGAEGPRLSERRMGKCLPVAGIAGVQVSRDNKLMLFMRDRRMVSLGLEKSCRARDFYSGFYVERSPDGQLCVDRDRLQSRSGANCALTRLRQLVEE